MNIYFDEVNELDTGNARVFEWETRVIFGPTEKAYTVTRRTTVDLVGDFWTLDTGHRIRTLTENYPRIADALGDAWMNQVYRLRSGQYITAYQIKYDARQNARAAMSYTDWGDSPDFEKWIDGEIDDGKALKSFKQAAYRSEESSRQYSGHCIEVINDVAEAWGSMDAAEHYDGTLHGYIQSHAERFFAERFGSAAEHVEA